MGCSSSKLDRLPAVSLCRDRTKLLEDALHRSYALADAHVAYLHSLRSFGAALRRLSYQSPPQTDGRRSSDSPARVGAALPGHSPSSSSGSTSSSGSHIHFDDSEDDNDDNTNRVTSSTASLLASDGRAGGEQNDYYNPESLNPFFERFVSISYMENQPTQSITHTLPVYDRYNDHNETSQMFYYSSSQNDGRMVPKAPPPPPPPPPTNSTWDILNFFDGYDGYAVPVASHNRAKEDSKVLKEEITHGDHGGLVEGAEAGQREHVKTNYYVKAPLVSVSDKVEPKEKSSYPAETRDGGYGREVSEIVKEVESLFQIASESGDKVSRLLDLAKFRYHHKNGVYQAPSRTALHATATSRTSLAAKGEGASGKGDGDRDGDAVVGSPGNFSGTLKKLCMWEKKLYNEVKAEEKLRVMHGKKCRELNQMSNKGADAAKIDATRAMIRALSTKLQIAIHVIHKISVKVNKIRDDELWPWIHQLVHGLLEMWKSMEECHRGQRKAVAKAKNLDSILSNLKQNDADHLQELVQIMHEIQNWTLCFSSWVFAQRDCIRALNNWLIRCLPHEPEQTPDGVAPFSPGRIGAPPVFVICNQWSQSMDRLSEKEVVDAMKELLSTVNKIYEQHHATLQQKIPADKEMERKVKSIERKEQKIHKDMQAKDWSSPLKFREDSAAPLSARGEGTMESGVQLCLKNIFKAMEDFSADSARAYEELCTRAEVYPHSRQSSKRF